MELEQLKKLLNESSADDWEITDTKVHGWEFYFIRHDLDQNRIRLLEEYKVTVYKDSADGQYRGKATNVIHPSATAEEAAVIINNLVLSASLVKNPIYTLASPKKAEYTAEKTDIAEVSKQFLNAMHAVRETETEDINSYEIFVEELTEHFISSTGIDVIQTYPNSKVEVVTNAREEGHEIELYRMYVSGTCDQDLLQSEIEKTLQYGKDRLKAVPTPNLNKADVVFSTDDAVTIYDFFLTKMNGQAVVMKMSDWKIGEEITNETKGDKVTLHAARYLKNSSVNKAYDSEGAPIRDLTLLENNVPRHYWASRMFASYLNMDDAFIISNYVVDGGAKSQAEIRNGDYLEIVEFSDFQVSGMTGDVFGEIRLGYYHHDGLVTVVTGGSISGNMNDYMKEMYLSKEQKQYDHALIPSLTKLCNMTVTGAE